MHGERVKEAAKNAKMLHDLDITRKKFGHFSEGRIRLAQTKAYEEKYNLHYLKPTKEKVNKDVGKPSDTTRRSSHGRMDTLAESGVMDAKWCKFHKKWGFHTNETCN